MTQPRPKRPWRLESVTFDKRHGYIASAPKLRQRVVALSLGGLRRKIEIALLLADEVEIVLQLDGLAERHRRGRSWVLLPRERHRRGGGILASADQGQTPADSRMARDDWGTRGGNQRVANVLSVCR